jgi:ATP-dependent RNA helicase RhlE
MNFEQLGLAEPILRAVAAAGYTTPSPIQAQAIPHVLAGRDLLGCAQTGTGKTAAFALPIIHRLTHRGNPRRGTGRRIRTLVLSPTRELALQIAESFQTYAAGTSLRQTAVVGGVNQNPQTRALKNGVDILVATPGRLLDLMEQGFIDLASVEVLVLDEADRMLDMGFLPDVRRVLRQVPKERQTLLFSATMPPEIQSLADAILRDPVRVRVAPVKSTSDLIEQSVYNVHRHHKAQLLAHLLGIWPIQRALVFTRTKHGADRLVRQLRASSIRAEAIHGNKSQSARQRTLANFKSSRTHILIATDIAARGIDVEGISHVLNYDIPDQPETYVHRIGRTGRAGASGRAVSFCDGQERKSLQAIERLIRQTLVIERPPSDFAPHPASGPPRPSSNRKPAGESGRPRKKRRRAYAAGR